MNNPILNMNNFLFIFFISGARKPHPLNLIRHGKTGNNGLSQNVESFPLGPIVKDYEKVNKGNAGMGLGLDCST